jgi:NADPH:quinone reductase
MQAATIVDGELRWRARADPVPIGSQLVVSVRAAGINAADLVQRRGLYPAPPGWDPDVPGMELAGEVVATGPGSTRFDVGDRVMAVVGGGAQAELALMDDSCAMPVPEGISWAEAGGFPEAFTTAYDALVEQADLKVGERVLVSGAAGGVGTAGVQLAAAAGATVIASARHPASHQALTGLGAAHVVVPDEVADHGPFDVVLELVGAASLEIAMGSLAIGARVVVIGVGGGSRVPLELFALMGRRARIQGSTLRSRPVGDKSRLASAMERRVVPLLASGRVRVPIAATLPLPRATDGYDRFAAGQKLGKIVLMGEA